MEIYIMFVIRIFALSLERPVNSSNVTNKVFFPRQFIESLRKDIADITQIPVLIL